MTEDDLVRILPRDEATFGADRARALRHAWTSAPEYAWCVGAFEATPAYAFGRHGANAEHIGPVVADSEAAAATVVRACIEGNPGRTFILDAPDWPGWRRTLADMGFHEQRPFTRMFRAGRSPGGHPEKAYAAFGPELG